MQKEKTLYQKYWWIPLAVIVAGTVVAFMVAGDKNNPEISSIDVSNVESREISGENRKVVLAREFRQFFYDNLGFQDNNLFDTYDSEYVLVTEKDILDMEETFFQYLKENNIIYKPSESDCDDFAKIFSRLFADKWNKGRKEKVPPAVGYFAFLRRDDQPHMIVLAFSEKNGVLHPMFFETRPNVHRTDVNEDEFLSMIGGEFN
jgi:hypothetical protein